MKSRSKQILAGCFLLFFLALFFRHFALRPGVALTDDTPWRLFRCEGAIHYYFSQQIASHGTGALKKLSTDERILYPAKSNTWAHYTMGMEFIPAMLKRWGLVENLARGIFYTTNFYFALKFVLLFLLLLLFSKSFALAFFLSLACLLAPESYERSLKWIFRRGDFGILFLCGAAITFWKVFKHPRVLNFIGLTASVIIALAVWHLSAFLLAGMFCLFIFLRWYRLTRWQKSEPLGRSFQVGFLTSGLITWLASFTIPVLSANAVFVSPFMLALLLFLPFDYAVNKWPQRPWRVLLTLSFLLLLGVGRVLLPEAGHSHIFEFALAKLKNLGSLPADPESISFYTRALFSTSLSTPELGDWVRNLGPLMLACAGLVILAMKQKRLAAPGINHISWGLFALALGWFATRNLGISVMILAAVIALVFSKPVLLFWRRLQKQVQWGLMTGAVLLCILILPRQFKIKLYGPPSFDPIVKLLKQHDDKKLVFTGTFYAQSSLLAFTAASITTHCKWEDAESLRRSEEFFKAMYGTIEDLISYMKKYQSNMLIFFDVFDQRLLRYMAAHQGSLRGTAIDYLTRLYRPGNKYGLRLLFASPRYRNLLFSRDLDIEPDASAALFEQAMLKAAVPEKAESNRASGRGN